MIFWYGCGIQKFYAKKCGKKQPEKKEQIYKRKEHKNGTNGDRATNDAKEDEAAKRDEHKLHLAYDPNCLFVISTTVVIDQI